MGMTFNMVGGSGGSGIPGNRAVLVARIPSGSTVIATKDGLTLTPMMWVSETYPDYDIALFVFTPAQFDNVNPWTITSTDGTRTASTTVLITSAKEYEVTLQYNQLLYNAGDEYTAITGGWDGGVTDPRYTQTTTNIKNADNINVRNTSGGSYGIITHNQIDLTNFSIIEIEWWRGSNAADNTGIKVAESFPTQTLAATNYGPVATVIPSTDPSNPTISQLDISNLTGNYKIGIQGALNSGIFFSRVELK